MQTIRIFISSPGDVAEERDRARQVVEGLRRRYAGQFSLKAVLWEDLPLQANLAFQTGIDLILSKEEGIDVAIFILWSRLGSPLGNAVHKEDGSDYRSGTERELDLMLQARKRSNGKRPSLLVYVRQDEASFDERLRGKPTREKGDLIAQKKLVEQFIAEEFHDHGAGHNLRAYHSFDRPVTFMQRLQTHMIELLDDLAGHEGTESLWNIEKEGPPFLGLEAFQAKHAGVFFGRETETLEARHALREKARQGCAFLLLSGASGSGKSSLARAGIAPAIVENELDEIAAWHSIVTSPQELGADPLTALVRRLAAADLLPELRGGSGMLDELIEGLRRDPSLTVRLRVKDAFDHAARRLRGGMRVLLILDQLEEIFAAAAWSEARRDEFLAAVEALASSRYIWVLATVRSDFSAQAQAQPALARMMANGGLLPVLPPTPDALRRVIDEPCRRAGLRFEQRDGQNLADQIFRDSAMHAEMLPLLEYVLRELFEHRTDAGVIPFSEYERLGGVEGAIGNRANQVIESLPEDARAAVVELFPLLVSVENTDDQNVYRRDAPLADLTTTPARRRSTEALIAARFLITREQGGMAVASLAHEALLRRWQQLRSWITENKELLQIRHYVQVAAADYWRQQSERQGPAGDLLLAAGLPLSRGERAIEAGILDRAEAEFVRRSRDKATAAQKKKRRILQITAIFFAAAAVLLAMATVLAWRKTREVKQLLAESDTERAERLFREEDAASGVWYLARALASGSATPEAAQRLWFAVTERSWPKPLFDPVEVDSDILAASFDSSGNRFVTATRSGAVTIFSSDDGHRIGEPLLHPKAVRGALFSPDDRKLLTACEDGLARLWDLTGPEPRLAATNKHDDAVAAIAWSGDGKFYATGSGDKRIRVWSVGQSETPVFTADMKEKVHTVAFDPRDSNRVLGIAKDESNVWEIATGRLVLHYQSLADLNGACFSPDGTKILSFSSEGDVAISDLAGGNANWTALPSLGAACRDAAISPDGKSLVTVSGASIHHSLLERPPSLLWERSLSSAIVHIRYTPDGKRLIAACEDGRIEVLDVQQGRRLNEPVIERGIPVAFDFHPRENRILSCRSTHHARIYSLGLPAPLPRAVLALGAPPLVLAEMQEIGCVSENGKGAMFSLPEHDEHLRARTFDLRSPVTAAAFDPAGTRVVAGDPEGGLFVSDLSAAQVIGKSLGKLEAPLSCLTFSEDGKLLAAGGIDGRLGAWRWPDFSAIPLSLTHSDKIAGLGFFGRQKSLVTAGWDRQISLATLDEKGANVRQWPLNGDPMGVASAAGGGAMGLALSSGEIWLIDESQQQPAVAFRVANPPSSMALSADGGMVAAGTVAGTVSVWDARAKLRIAELNCGDARINALSFSADGKWLATGAEDGQVRIWNAETGRPVTEPLRHESAVRQVLISKDQRNLISVDRTGIILSWPLIPTGIAEQAKSIAALCLQGEQRNGRRFVAPNEPIPAQAMADLRGLMQSMREAQDDGLKNQTDLLRAYLPETPAPSPAH